MVCLPRANMSELISPMKGKFDKQITKYMSHSISAVLFFKHRIKV